MSLGCRFVRISFFSRGVKDSGEVAVNKKKTGGVWIDDWRGWESSHCAYLKYTGSRIYTDQGSILYQCIAAASYQEIVVTGASERITTGAESGFENAFFAGKYVLYSNSNSYGMYSISVLVERILGMYLAISTR